MDNLGTVWVVISASEAQSRLVEFIDNGRLAEAVGYSNALKSLIEKMKSFVQQYGGGIPIYLYERIVMQLPSSAAEQLPSIIKGYGEALSNKIAVGIGLTMDEASRAAKKSLYSGEIEMFDPEEQETFAKSGMKARRWKTDVVLPPNTFDPTIPDEEMYTEEAEIKHTGIPSIEEAIQNESKLIQAIGSQIGMSQMQESMKQAQQQQAQAQQAAQGQEEEGQPRDLLEALHGGKVEGHNPEVQEEEQGEEQAAKAPEVKQAEKEIEGEIEEAESVTADDKIAMQLDNIKGQIPQIMGLATSNPKAFKQTMDMINKLIQLAHNRSKTTEKNETREKLDNLIKAINQRSESRPKTNYHRFPVNTRLGKWKKVMVNGKEKWRELSSGAIQDNTGQPISVRQHNREAKDNDRED